MAGPPSVENWQPVCELPCEAALDPTAQYIVRAPELPDGAPSPIQASRAGRATHLRAPATVGPPRYRDVWRGVVSVTLGSLLVGGMTAFAVNAAREHDTIGDDGGLALGRRAHPVSPRTR